MNDVAVTALRVPIDQLVPEGTGGWPRTTSGFASPSPLPPIKTAMQDPGAALTKESPTRRPDPERRVEFANPSPLGSHTLRW